MLVRHWSKPKAGRMNSRPTLDTGQHSKRNPSQCWPKCQVGRKANRPPYGCGLFADAWADGIDAQDVRQRLHGHPAVRPCRGSQHLPAIESLHPAIPTCANICTTATPAPAQGFAAPFAPQITNSGPSDCRKPMHGDHSMRPSMGLWHASSSGSSHHTSAGMRGPMQPSVPVWRCMHSRIC